MLRNKDYQKSINFDRKHINKQKLQGNIQKNLEFWKKQ